MKKLMVMAAVAAGATLMAANVTDTDDTSWWSLSGGVLTLDNSNADISSSTNIYTAVIGADVTKIVKTGPGAARRSSSDRRTPPSRWKLTHRQVHQTDEIGDWCTSCAPRESAQKSRNTK